MKKKITDGDFLNTVMGNYIEESPQSDLKDKVRDNMTAAGLALIEKAMPLYCETVLQPSGWLTKIKTGIYAVLGYIILKLSPR